MSFAQESGYIPVTVESIVNDFMNRLNTEFNLSPPYTTESFVGTSFYKYFYPIAQRIQESEVKTAEIVAKLQDYFNQTNEMLARPNTTNPGMIDYFKAQGFDISIKPVIEAEAGELRVAVDLEESDPDYEDQKQAFLELLASVVIGGAVTIGDESGSVTLSNAQSFDYRFNLADRIPIKLRLTLDLSSNNTFVVLSPEETAAILFENINNRYRFGLNFEPQRYFSVIDAPWAASVLLEYSIDDGATWLDDIAVLEYDEVYTFDLADISVVET